MIATALAVGRKELRQIARDRRTLSILLVVPTMILLLYGYALNWDIRHVRLGVDDRDHTPDSRAVVAAFLNSGYFDFAGPADSPADMRRMLDTNDARAVIVLPSGMSREVHAGRTVPVQVVLNGDNANTATTVMAYALTILQSESARLAALGGAPERQRAGVIRADSRIWYNPELRSTLFLVPGLIAYIAMITAVVSTSLSIVREKERGTMEQIRMAPVSALAFVLGKTLPYLVLSFASSLGIVVVSMALFGLPMHGSWWLLCLALGLFLVGALALGLLISSAAENQQVAFQAAMLASFLPTLMLSGFIFPIASMPEALRVVTYVVPARYFLAALRGILLKGVGFGVIWPHLAALGLIGAALLVLAAVRLQRQWT